MRTGIIALAVALGLACGEEGQPKAGPAARPEPIVPGRHLRVMTVEERTSESGWAWRREWLDLEGWDFVTFELRSASKADATITWREPRAEAPLATLDLGFAPRQTVRIVWAVRTHPLLLGPRKVGCDRCGATYAVSGAINPTWTCAKCKHVTPVDPAWANAPTRNFRVLVHGAFATFGKAGNVKSRRESETTIAAGTLRTRHVLSPEEACDVVGVMRRPFQDLPAGRHVFARLIALPPSDSSGRSRFGSGDDLQFSAESGNVVIRGTHEDYEILVDGRPVALADHPHPVWEFEVDYRPR